MGGLPHGQVQNWLSFRRTSQSSSIHIMPIPKRTCVVKKKKPSQNQGQLRTKDSSGPRTAQVWVDELRSASNAALVWTAEMMTDERARKRLTLPNASAAHSVYHASESRRSLHNPKIPLLKTPIWISEAKRAKMDFWID